MFAALSPAPRRDAGGQQAFGESWLNEGIKAIAIITNNTRLTALRSPGPCLRLIQAILVWFLVSTAHAGPGKLPGSGVKCPEPQAPISNPDFALLYLCGLGRPVTTLHNSSSSLNWGSSLPGCGEENRDRVWKDLTQQKPDRYHVNHTGLALGPYAACHLHPLSSLGVAWAAVTEHRDRETPHPLLRSRNDTITREIRENANEIKGTSRGPVGCLDLRAWRADEPLWVTSGASTLGIACSSRDMPATGSPPAYLCP